jgi:hypothetical protein
MYVILHKMRVPGKMTLTDLASTYNGKTARQWLLEIFSGSLEINSELYPEASVVASRIVTEMDYRYVRISVEACTNF